MKWSQEGQWVATGFSLVLILMGSISVVSYKNATHLAESANKVRQIHEMLETLTEILSALNESEAGRRGYILFNDPSELSRYNNAITLIKPRLVRLQQLTTYDVVQQEQLETLEFLISQRLKLSQKSIQRHQQNPLARPIQIQLRAASTKNRQAIQNLIAAMQQQEEQELERRVQQSQASIQFQMLLEFSGTFLTFLILLSIYALLYQQMVKRQQAEALQQKLAQEKELGELKLQFFSMVSHEFRTPLSSILGSAQILDEVLQPIVNKKKLKSLYRIRSAAQLMTQLLADILTLARAEAGNLDYNPTLVEMQTFCLNLLEDVQPINQSLHSIEFIMQGQCTHAYVDERLLYSILSNLLSNAIKYSPNGGKIEFTLDCRTDVLIFKVKDEGVGISPETQKFLYEPFRRGKNVSGISGTGLGLAVVKKCVDLHQGEVIVESEVDVGATFTIIIAQPKIEK